MKEVIFDAQCECANCGRIIDYRSNQAGEVIQCPRCGEGSQLPKPEKLLLLQPAGPPPPESKLCKVCGTQTGFFDPVCPVCEKARRQKVLRSRILIGAAVVMVFAAGVLGWRQLMKPKPVQARGTGSAADKPEARIMIAQPVSHLPKSTNDLRPSGFTLERRRGETTAIAVGDILNNSENVHHRMRADVDLLDKKGVKVGTVSDYFVDLGAHQTWHFVVAVDETNAMSVRFAGIKEDE